MKTLLLSTFLWFSVISLMAQAPKNPNIDYPGFLQISEEVQEYRESRLIDIETFNRYTRKENTIILDTRSKGAYEAVHIEGAIHLNFSDFTEEKLAEVIPSKETRILIYCNNNFISRMQALASKSAPLALNIPTFVNLYGYGYKNIYELSSYLDMKDGRVAMVINGQEN